MHKKVTTHSPESKTSTPSTRKPTWKSRLLRAKSISPRRPPKIMKFLLVLRGAKVFAMFCESLVRNEISKSA